LVTSNDDHFLSNDFSGFAYAAEPQLLQKFRFYLYLLPPEDRRQARGTRFGQWSYLKISAKTGFDLAIQL
jgi:hypothetical protein